MILLLCVYVLYTCVQMYVRTHDLCTCVQMCIHDLCMYAYMCVHMWAHAIMVAVLMCVAIAICESGRDMACKIKVEFRHEHWTIYV